MAMNDPTAAPDGRTRLAYILGVPLALYRFACGLGPSELAQDIATAEIGRKLELLDHEAPVLVRLANIRRQFEQLQAKREMLKDAAVIDRVRF